MKFGVFYEHQLPRPWDPDAEYRLLQEALEQCALADRLGIDYVWEVEHHFLEEYSHSSAPGSASATGSSRHRHPSTTRPAWPSASPRSTSSPAAA